MAKLDLKNIMAQVVADTITPRIKVALWDHDNVSSDKLEGLIKSLVPSTALQSGDPVMWPWPVAVLRASLYDPDPDSYDHQIEVRRTVHNQNAGVASPRGLDRPDLDPKASLAYFKAWTGTHLPEGPNGVTLAAWPHFAGTHANGVAFAEDYRTLMLRRVDSLQRLSLRFDQYLGQEPKQAPVPGVAPAKGFRPISDVKKDPNLQTKDNALGLGLLGGLLLLFLVTRGK